MQLTEVNPADIERELHRAWRDAAESGSEIRSDEPHSTEGAPQVRTVLSNFVLLSFGEDRDIGKHIDELVTALCITNPSRFFIVRFSNNEKAAAELKTYVSSRCVLARSGNHVCSEEVHLRISADTAYLVPNLLFSLFAADVPVVLMVVGDVFGESTLSPKFKELFAALRTQGDLVLFDTAQAKFFARATLPYLGLKDSIRVRDLSWYRSERWRVLIAEQFDSERFLSGVEKISQLKLTCAIGPESIDSGAVPADAILVAGWIAGALGWQADSCERLRGGGDLRVLCSRPQGHGAIAIDFVADKNALTSGAAPYLSRVQIVIDEEHGPLALDILRDPKMGVAAITTEHVDAVPQVEGGANFCDFSVLRVPFRVPLDEDLVLQPIYSTSDDPTFFRSAAAAAQISQLISK